MENRLIFLYRLLATKTRWGDGMTQVGRSLVVPVQACGAAVGKSAAICLGGDAERFRAKSLKASPRKTSSEPAAVRTANRHRWVG